jgi:hypothetical protein
VRLHFAILVLPLFALGCPLLSLSGGPPPTAVTSETITLEWNAPRYDLPDVLGTATYRLYYRPHGTGSWTLLQEIPAASGPHLMLRHSQLGDGSFDFGVTAVNAFGEASPLHSSLDADARPFGGWYIIWLRPGDHS